MNINRQLLQKGDISKFKIYFHFYPDSIRLQDLRSQMNINNISGKLKYIRNYSDEVRTFSYSEFDYINRIPDDKLLILM